MARSKDVYTVLGLMCIDPQFRNQFFEHPLKAARQLVGSLTDDEQQQLRRIAGVIGVAGDRGEYVCKLNGEFDRLQNFLQCPSPVSYTHLTLPTIYSV